MNIEELKLVLETIATLGAQGKEAFIWWAVLDTIPAFILWSLFIGVLYAVVGAVKYANSEVEFLTNLRDTLGYGVGYLGSDERTKTIVKVKSIVEAYVAENGTPYK